MNPLTNREDAAINGINAALGVILVLSPWLFGFGGAQTPTWTAVIGGAIIAIMALAALTRRFEWEEWVNLIAGLCVAVAPWVFGFTRVATAAWTHIVIGVLVALLAAIEVWRIHRALPARPA